MKGRVKYMSLNYKSFKSHLLDEIVEIVSWCEVVQDSPESKFAKRNLKKIAYDHIKEIVDMFLDQKVGDDHE